MVQCKGGVWVACIVHVVVHHPVLIQSARFIRSVGGVGNIALVPSNANNIVNVPSGLF